MKASKRRTVWASLSEALVLMGQGWRVLSYGTGPAEKSVLLVLGV